MTGKVLTTRQKRFVDILIEQGCSQQEAAIQAGYSEKTAKQIAYENLTKPYIIEYYERRLEQWRRRRQIDADRVLEEYRLVAFSTIEDIAVPQANGGLALDFNKIPNGHGFWRSVASVKTKHIETQSGPLIISTEFKFWNKLQALRALGAATGAVPSTVPPKALEDPREFQQIESPTERFVAMHIAMLERLRIAQTELGPMIDVTPTAENAPNSTSDGLNPGDSAHKDDE